MIDLKLVLEVILDLRLVLEVILDCMVDLESRQASLYLFSKPASPFQSLFFSKTPFPSSKVPPYLSHPLLLARLQVLHHLFNCLSSFETGFCLLIAYGSARFPVRYLSHLNSVSSFTIQKMGSRLLIHLQLHPNRNNSIQIM